MTDRPFDGAAGVVPEPGGDVAEAGRIAALLAETKDVRFVALVEKAHSAAAAVAMACPEICMTPAGTVGNVIPYLTDAEGKVTTTAGGLHCRGQGCSSRAGPGLGLACDTYQAEWCSPEGVSPS